MKFRYWMIGGLLAGAVTISACAGKDKEMQASTAAAETVSEAAENKTIRIDSADAASGKPKNESSAESESIGPEQTTGNSDGAAGTESGLSDGDESKEPTADPGDDFTEAIRKDIKNAENNASTLQEELKGVEKVYERYRSLFRNAEAQVELNMASSWLYTVWDDELNSLWKRISDSASPETKAALLAEQRKWNAMKREVTLENLGRPEEGGSIYPLLENGLLEDITKNRSYILAGELAKIKGQSFAMPEKSVYGTYVDNQGTNSVYSSLIVRKGWENDDEAVLSLYRVGTVSGTFTDKGGGVLDFVSVDGDVKGTIRINGWKGATFEVTESKGGVLQTGDRFAFDFVF